MFTHSRAIYTIIQEKLFRCKYQSVENYFRNRWDVSRAQAYRFMDCHPILEALSHLDLVPHRIRICQNLKKVAGLSKQKIVQVWESCVEQCHGDEEAISSFEWSKLAKVYNPSAASAFSRSSQPASLVYKPSNDSDEDSDQTLADGSVSSSRRRKRELGSTTALKRSKGEKPLPYDLMGFSTEIELAHILTRLSDSAHSGKSTWKLCDIPEDTFTVSGMATAIAGSSCINNSGPLSASSTSTVTTLAQALDQQAMDQLALKPAPPVLVPQVYIC
ncbi:hypothetical protein HDV03_003125 [Kappamyces sp. JEL0829]|nr:hypothetical protein HDV03_003110 [Kappamyces sp. JEL0829]KAJ3304139.1 hypothetical protein HDV03_003125 [Kappamyces sp. JEL0829]